MAASLYAAVFSVYTCLRHDYDTGTVDQGIWLAGHSSDVFVTVRGLPLLGDHVRLVSYVLAPLYWVWDDLRALLIAQSVVLALGGWLVWRIASRQMPSRPWLGAALAVSYLLNPAVQNLNLDHVHPDAFATTLLLFCINALRSGRLGLFAVAAALAMSCKEDVPLVFVAWGFAMLFDARLRRFGVGLMAVSGAYFALCLLVILPWFNDVGFFRMSSRGIFVGFAANGSDPFWLFGKLWTAESGQYLFSLGLANLFLFLAAPLSLLPALPALAANLLSNSIAPRNLEYHYQTSIIPFLYLGAIDVWSRLARWASKRGADTPITEALPRDQGQGVGAISWALRAAPLVVLLAAVGSNVLWSKLPVHRAAAVVRMSATVSAGANYETIRKALKRIPDDAVVSAHYSLVPQLSHRPGIYMFPNPFEPLNWGVSNQITHDPDLIEYIIVRNIPARPPAVEEAEAIALAHGFRKLEGDSSYAVYHRPSRYYRAPVDKEVSCADWNADGRVDSDDIALIASAIMKKRTCPPNVCDADGDGAVLYKDVLRINASLQPGGAPLDCPK